MLKKILAFLLACALAVGFAGCTQTVVKDGGSSIEQGGETENPGNGTENPGDGTENPGGGETENPGSGTEEDPYLVYNAEMFLEMAEYPAGTYFRQANDIDLSAVDTGEKVQSSQSAPLDRWKPIGTRAQPFASHYDGAGYTISGLSVQRLDSMYNTEAFGLFGWAKDCEIKNVNLVDYRMEVQYAVSVGALVGYAQNCRIVNCSIVQGEKEDFASGSWSFSNMGGLVGFSYESYIENCSVTSDLGLYHNLPSGSQELYPVSGMLGGVVGEAYRSTVLNCTFSGSMESGVVAGGIVGRCDGALIAGCESEATVTASLIAGGIAGQLWRSELQYSEFSGQISYPLNAQMAVAERSFFGGIAGDFGLNYNAYENISGNRQRSSVESCRFSGTIAGDSTLGEVTAYAGGICARLFDCDVADTEVSGNVRGAVAGGILAEAAADAIAPSVRESVIGSIVLSGGSGAEISAPEVFSDIFVDSSVGREYPAPQFTVVNDWTGADLPLGQERWVFGNGIPTLKYAGLLPEEMLASLRAGYQPN